MQGAGILGVAALLLFLLGSGKKTDQPPARPPQGRRPKAPKAPTVHDECREHKNTVDAHQAALEDIARQMKDLDALRATDPEAAAAYDELAAEFSRVNLDLQEARVAWLACISQG